MEITDVRIRLVRKKNLRAFANITFDDCFVVRGLKVIEEQGRLSVAMPSRKLRDGRHQDVVRPIDPRTRMRMESVILHRYVVECELEGGDGPEACGVPSPLVPPPRPQSGWRALDPRGEVEEDGGEANLWPGG